MGVAVVPGDVNGLGGMFIQQRLQQFRDFFAALVPSD
jgi:hypothetical protein